MAEATTKRWVVYERSDWPQAGKSWGAVEVGQRERPNLPPSITRKGTVRADTALEAIAVFVNLLEGSNG